MWAACASSSPAASNRAQEKSRRSLMLAENATRCSVIPISSAAASKRLRMSSSSMGSTVMVSNPILALSRCNPSRLTRARREHPAARALAGDVASSVAVAMIGGQ